MRPAPAGCTRVSMAQGMIVAGMARNVLTVGVDLQSRLLDPADRNTLFIFGDGAGAAVVSASGPGHPVRRIDPGRGHPGPASWPAAKSPATSSIRAPPARPVDSPGRPAAVPVRDRRVRLRHPAGHGRHGMDRRGDAVGHSAPGQRPDAQGGRQAVRRGVRAFLHEHRARGQYLQREHPVGAASRRNRACSPATRSSCVRSAPA